MSGYRDDLEAARRRIAQLEDQLGDRKPAGGPGPWKRALLWLVPALVWALWFVYAVHDIDAHRAAIRNESFEPGQNLAACLDFALDNFSTPSASKREACNERFPKDQAEATLKKAEHSKHIIFDIASLVLAVAALGGYFAFVPRRFRAGFRVWIFVIIGGALLTVVALLVILSGMPHGD
jgi:hypothetical protein